jgi:hypothetical protein
MRHSFKNIFVKISLILGLFLQSNAHSEITYTVNLNGADPGTAERIENAMKEAVDFYNAYGTFDKKLTANWSPGTPTADANWDGWMNFGGSIGTRVAMHEIGHTLGIGTAWEYWGLMQGGAWKGATTNAKLSQFWGPNAVLNGDGLHIWPYGLNFDGEDGTIPRKRMVQIVQAMRCDMGIGPCTEKPIDKFALNIQLDINTAKNMTEIGYSALSGEPNSTVNIEGVGFTIFGNQIGNVRDTGIKSYLLTDFAFSDGDDAFVGLRLEHLPAGPYTVQSRHYDRADASGSVNVIYRKQGEVGKVLVSGKPVNDANTANYTIESDGVSTYELVFQEADGYNHAVFNGLTITPRSTLVRPGILREYWFGVRGLNVSDLTSLAAYPNKPTGSEGLASFEAPANIDEVFGSRISGFLYAPVTGNYTFWISGDDSAELWLSTNASPSTKRLIAKVPEYTNQREWNKYPEQKSITILLQAGQAYYIEALHKEQNGGDHLSVAWQRPDNAQIEVLSNQYFIPPLGVPDNNENTIKGILPANVVKCADEYQTCVLPSGSTASVWYGASNTWIMRNQVSGNIACNNDTFGDPFYGVIKSCWYSLDKKNLPPVVELNQPMTKSVSNTEGYIEATATDNDGSITKVEFYYGDKLLNTVSNAPYVLHWSGVADGTYALTAKAYDDKGNVTISNAVTVVINSNAVDKNHPPIVSLNQPVANTSNNTGYIEATAKDSDGSIAKVEFYYGNTLLSTAYTAPYRANWTNAPAGTYNITAKAYDNVGAVAMSQVVPVVVK